MGVSVPHLDVCAGKAARCKGRIQALRGEVQQLLEVRIHHDLLLEAAPERLAARQRPALTRGAGCAARQPAAAADIRSSSS